VDTLVDRWHRGCVTTHRFERTITLPRAVALYVGAVVGAGVLLLPGVAASTAGPASLLAWAFVGLLGVPLALSFAALARRYRDPGGVAAYTGAAFGPAAGAVVGWSYYVAGSVGMAIVPLTGGYYVAAALEAGDGVAFAVAGAILVACVVANLHGLRVSGRVQMALSAAVAALLAGAAIGSLPRLEPARFDPFFAHGLAAVGEAAVPLFFAFAGWEAITHLSAEFRDPRRDLPLASGITIALVLCLYLAVSVAVVGTGSYGDAEQDRVAVARILGDSLGVGVSAAAGVAAALISLGTTNAFIASVSRLGYALARDGSFPRALARLTGAGVPAAAVVSVGLVGAAGLAIALVAGLGAEDLLLVPSSLVVLTYVAGMAAGVRLLAGRERALAAVGLALCAAVTPFAGTSVVVPLVVGGAAVAYRRIAGGSVNQPPRGRQGEHRHQRGTHDAPLADRVDLEQLDPGQVEAEAEAGERQQRPAHVPGLARHPQRREYQRVAGESQ
jgi:amino acid efflux transporter